MTTSGAVQFNPATTQVITGALRKMGVINEDEVPTAGQYADLLFCLNAMTKEWMASGIHVWTEAEGILFLQQLQRRYLIGGTTTDHVCDANAWTLAVLSAGAAQGATAVVVTNPAGILATHNFGIVTNNGDAFWTTVLSVVGSTVNLNAALPAPCNAGNLAFDYPVSAQLVRPLRVPFARRLQYAQNSGQGSIGAPDWGGIITPLSPMMSRQDYFNLPQPQNPGLVTQAYYDPALSQGEMWVWNVQQNANFGLRFTYYRPIQDWVSPANTGDLPQEWANAIIWNLAKEASLDYSVPATRAAIIITTAKEKLELVQGWDREDSSIYFGRSSSQTRG